MNAIEVLQAAGFNAFAEALIAHPYGEVIGGGGYTIFAPSDEAFAKFPDSAVNTLHDNEAASSAVLGYHFAVGRVRSEQFIGKRIRAVMYASGDVIIDGKSGMRVNGARLVRPDIDAGASIVHGIDGVLWPPSPQARLR